MCPQDSQQFAMVSFRTPTLNYSGEEEAAKKVGAIMYDQQSH